MPRRKWEAKTTAMLVLEGLKGKAVAALCPAHPISQAPYDQWREQFLAHAPNACEVHEHHQKEARLEQDHARLQSRVGE
jgi:hypothetical protein